MLQSSHLIFHSLGRVAANKPLATNDKTSITNTELEVVLIERNPTIDGEITDNVEKYSANATDNTGAAYSLELDTSNSVKAKWCTFGRGNRVTAPDLRRGDSVMVWRFDNVDEYFWTEMDDMLLRKLETVIWAFSGTKEETAGFDTENCYYIELSTHKGLIHLHTSEANGEFCGFDIQINALEGFLQIQDTVGQSFMVNSKERQLELLNNDGSKVFIDKREIHIFAEDLIAMKAKKITIDATDQISTITNNTLKASKNVIAATTNELTADSNSITAKTNHTGDYSIQGKLGVTGLASFSGGLSIGGKIASMGGGFNFTGGGMLAVDQIVSTGNVTAPNIK